MGRSACLTAPGPHNLAMMNQLDVKSQTNNTCAARIPATSCKQEKKGGVIRGGKKEALVSRAGLIRLVR